MIIFRIPKVTGSCVQQELDQSGTRLRRHRRWCRKVRSPLRRGTLTLFCGPTRRHQEEEEESDQHVGCAASDGPTGKEMAELQKGVEEQRAGSPTGCRTFLIGRLLVNQPGVPDKERWLTCRCERPHWVPALPLVLLCEGPSS